MNLESWLGLLIVVFTALGIGLFSGRKVRASHPAVLRKIPAINRLRRAIGVSVEDGSRVHLSLGNADLNDATNPSALVGLSVLHRIGQLSSSGDQPPIATSGDGGFALLSKDVLSAVASETNTRESYDPNQAFLTGVTPFSYALGAMDVIAESGVRTNVLVGQFGAESGFLAAATTEHADYTLAASDSIVAQSVFLASGQDTLIGEELFALPAYLGYKPAHIASLRVQDLLRLLVGFGLILGAILSVTGVG